MAILQNNFNSFELSYAGIPFQVNEPEIDQWIRARIPRQYLQEIVPPPDWISRTMMSLALPGQAYPVPPLEINEFFYPTGASRWAQGHFLATETAALKMISAAYSHSSGAKSLPFIMNAPIVGQAQDVDPNPGITTNLFMLPPRPLLQVDSGLDGLYLVTLVDERYYGYLSHTALQFDNGATWSAYITSLATALGVNLTIPSIATAFGSPSLDSSLWATFESPAYLLDAAAWNICTTVVRNFDGTYRLQQHSDTSYFKTRPKFDLAGGAFSDALDATNQIPSLEAVLPASITVTFPKYWSFYGYIDQTGTVAKPGRYNPRVNEPYLDVVSKTINISHSTAVDVQGNPISAYHGTGLKVLRTSGKAYFTNFTDSTALNDSDLQNLAQVLADNYWSYQALGMDEVYLGIRGWQPEGNHDVIWTYRKERPTTRVMRKPWNFWPLDFQHELVPNSGNHDGANAGNPGTELLFCNNSTPDGSQRYDSFIVTKTNAGGPSSLTTTSGEEVWLHAANGEALTSGTTYLGRLMTLENGRKIFDTVVPTTGSASGARVRMSAATQSISNATNTEVTFGNSIIDYDLASYYDGVSRFSAPATGYYHISAGAVFQGNSTGRRGIILCNGVSAGVTEEYRSHVVPAVTASVNGDVTVVSTSTTVHLNQGDIVAVSVFQDSGGTLSLLNDQDTSSGVIGGITGMDIWKIG